MNRLLSILLLTLFVTAAFAATKTCNGPDSTNYACDTRLTCCHHKNKDSNAVLTACCRGYEECCDGQCCNKLTQWCVKTRHPDKSNTRYCTTVERPSPTAAAKIVLPPALGFVTLLTVFLFSVISRASSRPKDGDNYVVPTWMYVVYVILAGCQFGLLQMFTFTASWAWTFYGAVILGFALYAAGLQRKSYLYASLIAQGFFVATLVGIVPIATTVGDTLADLSVFGPTNGNDGNRGFFYPFQTTLNNAMNCQGYYDGYFGLDANLINPFKENGAYTWGYCSQGFLGTLILLGLVLAGLVAVTSVITIAILTKRTHHTTTHANNL